MRTKRKEDLEAALAALRASEHAGRQKALWFAAHRDAFQAAMNRQPMATSLGILVGAVPESAHDDRHCAFYLTNRQGNQLRHVVGMSEAYARLVDGSAASAEAVALGLAAATGEPVVTHDVLADPRWEPWRQLARDHGYRACWLFPIGTTFAGLVGCLVIYLREPRSPARQDLELAADLTHTAATIICRQTEVEERDRAEAALRDSEERQAFLLGLNDTIRPLEDPAEMRRVASRMLGERLQVDRVSCVDYEFERGYAAISGDYCRGDLRSVAGKYPIEVFRTISERTATGQTWVVADATGNAAGPLADLSLAISQTVGACVVVPLVKAGRIQSMLCVVLARPRDWTRREIDLIEQTTERLWVAVQRARAEARLRESEERLQVALEAGRMGTYRLNLATGEQQWSPGQYDIFGLVSGTHPPSRELFMSLVHPDDHHRVAFSPEDIRTPGTYLDSEFRIVRPDGEVRWIVAHALAVFDVHGRPAELIGVNRDVTEQRRLEAAMHSSEERLREFSEASSDILWIRRASDYQLEYLSPAFHRIYGVSRLDAMRGDNYSSWSRLIIPEDRERALASIERVLAGNRVAFEYRVRRPEDGELRWLRDTDFPIRDESGVVVRIGGISHDITPLKLAGEHQRLLLHELQHRVRNTLAVIRSITRRTAATTETKDEFFMHLDGRIDAFARVQAAVTRNPTTGVDLAFLVAEEFRVVGVQEGSGLIISGPPVALRSKAAETFGLAIHELVTNAMKHGALAYPNGRIEVRWQELGDAEGKLEFDWLETGLKHLRPNPHRSGFGTEILEQTLAYELGAVSVLDFRPSGLHCRITLPLGSLLHAGAEQ